jgi:chromosome segregation ATPase
MSRIAAAATAPVKQPKVETLKTRLATLEKKLTTATKALTDHREVMMRSRYTAEGLKQANATLKTLEKNVTTLQAQVKQVKAELASQQPGKAPTAQQQSPAQGWGPSTARPSPAAAAKTLAAHLNSPAGTKQASKIIDTIASKSELARALNWEAANIKSVKPNGDGSFSVEVQFDVLGKNDTVKKHLFYADVTAAGKVLSVPQG